MKTCPRVLARLSSPAWGIFSGAYIFGNPALSTWAKWLIACFPVIFPIAGIPILPLMMLRSPRFSDAVMADQSFSFWRWPYYIFKHRKAYFSKWGYPTDIDWSPRGDIP